MTLDYFYGQSGELFSYFRIPKALFQDCRFRQLSTDARTLYGILLDRMSLSVKNGWLDEQGRVYIIYTVREVQESICCASLMVMNGVSMKQVQEWLGHSTFSTTADIYAHLDYKSKQGSAGVIVNLLGESKFPK